MFPQDWLYDEGDDASKGVYIAKMEEIRAIAGPVIQRHFEKVEAERRALQERLEAEAAAKRAAEEEARKKAEAEAAAEAEAKAAAEKEKGESGESADVPMADADPAGKPEVEEAQ